MRDKWRKVCYNEAARNGSNYQMPERVLCEREIIEVKTHLS